MQFHVSYSIEVERRDGAEARFKETGAMPPDGVSLFGRWHDTGGRRGFMIVEASDMTLVAKYLRDWTDLITFEIVPVINDEQLLQIMS
jgi:hypothetical protein